MWEAEATKPADLTAPHKFPSAALLSRGGEYKHGSLRFQGWGRHKGGTKENGGHILGVRPFVNICERERAKTFW